MAKDCLDLMRDVKYSGVHTITVKPGVDVDVYCDQSADDGGWTVSLIAS